MRRNSHEDRLFVLFSHHPVTTLVNDYDTSGRSRVLAAEVEALLLRFPNVIAWVNGHTHRHTVTPHLRAPHSGAPGGFWEITDLLPHRLAAAVAGGGDRGQSRRHPVADRDRRRHGRTGPAAVTPGRPAAIAALSRELAVNAWQRRSRAAEPPGRGRHPIATSSCWCRIPTGSDGAERGFAPCPGH